MTDIECISKSKRSEGGWLQQLISGFQFFDAGSMSRTADLHCRAASVIGRNVGLHWHDVSLHCLNVSLQCFNAALHCLNVCLHRLNVSLHRFIVGLQRLNVSLHQLIASLQRLNVSLHRLIAGLHRNDVSLHRLIAGLHQSDAEQEVGICKGRRRNVNTYIERSCIMAQFPRTEPEIVTLATRMEAGLLDNPAVYPAPPVVPPDLSGLKASFDNAANTAAAAYAAAESATADKKAALDSLVEALKSNIRYAENTVNFDDDKLKLIGWAGRATSVSLLPPGEVRNLEVLKQGAGWIVLDWKKPVDGGAVTAYKVMRRERPAGEWESVATAVVSEATLVDQPTGKELEYVVVAVNKAGEGAPSTTQMAVL